MVAISIRMQSSALSASRWLNMLGRSGSLKRAIQLTPSANCKRRTRLKCPTEYFSRWQSTERMWIASEVRACHLMAPMNAVVRS